MSTQSLKWTVQRLSIALHLVSEAFILCICSDQTLDGNDAMIKLLVENGADVNMNDVEGMVPLMWAISKNRLSAVQTLISCGADVEARSVTNLTPLHKAVGSKNFEMSRLLLTLGSDVNARAPMGLNPLTRATAHGNTAMIALLEEHGAVPEVMPANGVVHVSLPSRMDR